MAQEFKIGRLRFTWKGAWTPATVYARDDVVSYQGKTYVCVLPNTSSATFYNDLYFVTQTGANTPFWNLTMEGKTFVGNWSASQPLYSLGNIVIFGGVIYFCNTQHVPTTFASQSGYWTEYTEFSAWRSVGWTPNIAYGKNDLVKWGGVVYKCIANHTSATYVSPTYLGLEANQSSWTIVDSGIEYKGSWDTNGVGYRYKYNDIVKKGPDLWLSNSGHISTGTFDQTKWSLWMPGFEYSGTWDLTTTYQPGDTVQYGGYTYVNKTANNVGNTPSTDAVNWNVFTQGYEWKAEWTNSTIYKIGDVVRRHGVLFIAVADNNIDGTVINSQDPSGYVVLKNYNSTGSSGTILAVNNTTGISPGAVVIGAGFTKGQSVISITDGTSLVLSAAPDATLINGQALTFSGINYVYWKILVPGTFWTKNWSNGVNYTVGDLVVWGNTTYVCIQNNTGTYNAGGSSNNRPDLDTTNIYWIIYVPHARKNALTTYGDIETYNSGAYSAVAIGSQSYTLRNTGGVPTWTKINIAPAVYYVSTSSGIDRSDYGTTWDQPWKTIRYACDTIGAGLSNPTSGINLSANKSWILAEFLQWTLYQITNNISPYSGYVLDQTKAVRDAGYIIDAIAYDISRGGNSQSVATALSYFAFGSSNVFYNTAVQLDVPYYLPMITQLGSLISNALLGTSPVSSYQTLNNISPKVSQVAIISSPTDPTAAPKAATAAASLLSIITTALTNGNTNLVPAQNSGITATIFVKSGTYPETLPISVPENVAIVGDELRSVIVEPAISITTTTTSSSAVTNKFTVASTAQMADQLPVQFVNPSINAIIGTAVYTGFGGITPGKNYYIVGSSITPTAFSITASTGTYNGVSSIAVSSVGTGALFNVTPTTAGSYLVTLNFGGSGYLPGDTIRILSANLGVPAIVAGSLVTGQQYTITTVGTTDYTIIGANSNTVGLRFTATGAGAGTGTATTTANDVAITISTVGGGSGAVLTFTSVSSTILPLTTFIGGNMAVYAGDCLKDMFRFRNASGLRNTTLVGLLGTLGNADTFSIQRPTGGSYASLDPGSGASDTSAWIFRRSPYVQNVTAFGTGCAGLKIDGTLHNGGNKSIVCNDFTHIISDGIGIWCTGPSALTEAVSVFSYYGYCGYFAENGGRIRATNGNTSYGTYGVIAEGYDITETPATGIVFNQSSQVQATVQSSFGSNSQLLRLTYSNSGSGYYTTTTNLLNHSNNFLGASWTSDTNVAFNKNTTALTGLTEGWSLVGGTSGPDGSYVSQTISIPPAGTVYTAISGITNGGGIGATFNVTVTATAYLATVNYGGSGYVSGDTIFITGSQLGGTDAANSLTLTISGLSGNSISQVTVSPTSIVPAGSAQTYTLSLYVKQGTATSIDLYGIFKGSATLTSSINFNFATGAVTSSNSGSTAIYGTTITAVKPVNYGALNQQLSSTSPTVGWYRIWFSVYDATAQNTQLEYRIYPRGYSGSIGQYSYVYGCQTEISSSSYSPSFYLEVANTSKYTAYANYNITGAGTGVVTIGDEPRGNSVFQTRITTDSNGVTGGAGYLTASNNAQGGNTTYVQLSSSDINTNSNYTGMRMFLQSGTGAGQYGYISYFNSGNKNAYVLKESFTPVSVSSTSATGNLFTASGSGTTALTGSLYVGQPVQFIPTYYTTPITSTNLAQTSVTAAVGGTTNTFTIGSTIGLSVNTPVTFASGATGAIFSSVNAGYTYYIYAIIDSVTIQVSQQAFGTVWQLNAATGNMVMNFSSNAHYLQGTTNNMTVNYPIQFTGTALGGLTVGTTYYINDVIDSSNFTISGSLVSVTVTVTSSSTNAMTVTSTASLAALNPIIFSNPTIGGLIEGNKYYISQIIDTQTFSVASTLLTPTVTATQTGTNLITVTNTTGFVLNQPIIFSGNSVGGIDPERVYYILAINTVGLNGKFTISQTPGSSAINLSSATGNMTARTCPAPVTLTSATGGSMVGSTTSKKTTLSLGIGTMTGTFSTQLFGGVTLGQIYYINTIPTNNTFTVTLTQGSGTAITLTTKTGSMNLAAVGWDHINPGTPIAPTLSSDTVYYIEPRTTYSAPTFIQTASTTTVTLTGGTAYSAMAYGNNYWIALPNGNSTAAGTADGVTWTTIPLPATRTWTDIAYGNNYWIAISSDGTNAYISKANGRGWRASGALPFAGFTSIAYGNGIFVALAANTANAVYSSDYGTTWNLVNIAGRKNGVIVGSAQLSTAQFKYGISSLALNGTTDYVTVASSVDFAFSSNEFTIECWIRPTAVGSAQSIFDMRTQATDVALLCELSASGQLRLYVNGSYVITHGTAITTGQWSHIAVARSSGTTTLYLNGVAAGTTYADANTYIAKPIVIGAYYTGGTKFGGYVDDFRVSSVARYTTGFSTPGGTFTLDSSTAMLFQFDGPNAGTAITNTETWKSITWGNGVFVAISTNSSAASYSSTGATWSVSTLPSNTSWSSIAYGQNTFVAVSSTSNTTAYTSNGNIWYSSNLPIVSSLVKYGNGVFLALSNVSGVAYTSEDGVSWTPQTVTADGYGAAAFGFIGTAGATQYNGVFLTMSGSVTGSAITTGARAKGRASVTSGVITAINQWEGGGGYIVAPTITFTDPNVTTLALPIARLSNGSLSSPTFVSRGLGYNSNSTFVQVTGNGYADQYQTGLTVILNNLTRLPSPGDNLTITGISQIYKVTSAYSVYNTVAPNLQANVSVSPAITTANSTANGTVISIRSKYSQARLTNHDFLNIGYGDFSTSQYPGYPAAGYVSLPQNQAIEANYGRVFYTSTDQDGNFKVGSLFGVQQATGIITLSATQFGLTGLSTLSLGGISVGGSSVVISQFSTDSTFTANSDSILPTQKAIKSYLSSRLSQGGANTFTGNLIAGTVSVGGPNYIKSTVPNGTTGSVVKMINKVYFTGQSGASTVDGNIAALDFFARNAFRRS
jgi:hypothetical protein